MSMHLFLLKIVFDLFVFMDRRKGIDWEKQCNFQDLKYGIRNSPSQINIWSVTNLCKSHKLIPYKDVLEINDPYL